MTPLHAPGDLFADDGLDVGSSPQPAPRAPRRTETVTNPEAGAPFAPMKARHVAASTKAARAATSAGLAQAVVPSPVGDLLLLASDAGLRGLWFLDPGHDVAPEEDATRPGWRFVEQARAELVEYFAGRRQQFDVPLDPHGTPFQEAVWRRLVAIDCGTTSTYGAIAREIGKPNAFRAVGLAVGANPIAIIVPCHRVIGESGALTGFAGGLPRKRLLLGLELGPETLPLAARRAG
jgi:methylated-DNA-[protein]-cysteine S-methyltransferase